MRSNFMLVELVQWKAGVGWGWVGMGVGFCEVSNGNKYKLPDNFIVFTKTNCSLLPLQAKVPTL